ncbi:MAG: hypothetical protein RBS07_11875 [Lentimicrobium sp.]|jgi:hypothetical protein|nr:hypothetical protein [Lentimicrobium sp.]
MKNNRITLRFAVVTAIVLTLTFSRLLPHPFNFSPLAALALFGGAHYAKRRTAYLIPIIALWMSDLFLNYTFYGNFVPFYPGAVFTYASFALIVLLGSLTLNNLSPRNLFFTSLSASVVFFIVSNLGVWISGSIYPINAQGFVACYTAAIPFFRNTLAGDLIYSFVVFYGFAIAQSRLPRLRTA